MTGVMLNDDEINLLSVNNKSSNHCAAGALRGLGEFGLPISLNDSKHTFTKSFLFPPKEPSQEHRKHMN